MTVSEIIKGLKTQLYEIILQYFKHYKHVLSGKLDGYDSNNREKSCYICLDNDVDNEDRLRNYDLANFDKLFYENIAFIRLDNLPYLKKRFHLTYSHPIIKKYWLYKPIRDIYWELQKKNEAYRIPQYQNIVYMKHNCGHRTIEFICFQKNRNIKNHEFIDYLKSTRKSMCHNCEQFYYHIDYWKLLYEWFWYRNVVYRYRMLSEYAFHIVRHKTLNIRDTHCKLCRLDEYYNNKSFKF